MKILRVIGYDREGRPAIYIRIENFIPANCPIDEYVNYFASFLEYVIKNHMKGNVD